MPKTTMKYRLLILAILAIVSGFFYKPQSASAVSCSRIGQCVDNKRCVCVADCSDPNPVIIPGEEDCGAAIIGGVTPPTAVHNVNISSRSRIGVIFFISRLLNFGAIIAGLFVVGNFISAGVMYISGASTGDTGTHVKVKDKITYSIIGLVIIVSAYTIAGIIGLIFFGDATFIFNPQLEGAI